MTIPISDPIFTHKHDGTSAAKFPFTNLSDTPNSYAGKAGNVVTVNATQSGLTFTPPPHTIYFGYVNANGTAGTPFPSGWTSGTSGGVYTVTHNLGSTNYGLNVTEVYVISSGSTDITFIYGTPGANSFQVSTKTGTSIAFSFILTI